MRVVKVIMMTVVLMCFSKLYGQNNQIKLYIQQIAANKVYIEYLQKGYSIVKTGLTTIGNIKNGHFSLDQMFFDDLQRINPRIRGHAKVLDIVTLNVQIIKRADKLIRETRNSELFKKGEVRHVEKCLELVLTNNAALIDEMESLLKRSALKMSDDERIKRIEELQVSMRSNYSFVNYFEGELRKLLLQKQKEFRDKAVVEDLLMN